MDALLEPVVIVALVLALALGVLIGRMGRARRVDPSDFSSGARPHSGRLAGAPITIPAAPHIDVPMPPEVLAHLQNGKIINAIKALREAHPELGLKEAKDAVDAHVRRNGL